MTLRFLRHLAIAALAVQLYACPASADVAARSAPEFTAEERVVIERNNTLKLLVKDDPWTVKSFLDVLMTLAPDGDGETALGDDGGTPSSNPDIDKLERSSPEAAHDLMQIIKQAGAAAQDGTAR